MAELEPPNLVVVVVDDMPKDMVDAMPYTSQVIRDLGVRFPNAFITTPLCAPSRSSILTGKPARSHGVWQNTGPVGGYKVLEPQEDHTIATALSEVGYATGLFGKYMNGWSKHGAVTPPGWDVFRAMVPDDGGDGAYYNYSLEGTGDFEHHGSLVEDYSTDVIASHAQAWVATQQSPLFLYFAPYGSHQPAMAAPRHEDTWPLEPLHPATNDSNALRAPWTRNLPPQDEDAVQALVRDQHECLRSVDDAIAAIVLALGSRIDNTVFIVAGDNGLMRGQHRMKGKNLPYQAAANVNMFMRFDNAFTPGSVLTGPVTNEDLAATIVAAAGGTLLGCEGTPFGTNDKGGVLLEGAAQDGAPAWIAWRTKRYLYVDYGAGQGEELYDYQSDPYEHVNVAPQNPPQLSQFRAKARLEAGGQSPPGFVPFTP